LKITKKVKESIKKHSLEESPNECCGIVLKNNGRFITKKCKNISENPTYHCVVSEEDLKNKIGDSDLFAIYHSHFDEKELSWADKNEGERLKTNIILYCVKDDCFDSHEPDGFVAPFVGREWTSGITTCIDLLEDYYRKLFNIGLTGHEKFLLPIIEEARSGSLSRLEGSCAMSLFFKSAEDSEEGRRLKKMIEKYKKIPAYLNFLKHNEFYEVKALEKHDVILTKTWNEKWNKKYNIYHGIHSMVYLGDGKVLHHPWKQTSRIEKLNTNHKLAITNILRHEKAR